MWDRKRQLGTIMARRRSGDGEPMMPPSEIKNEVVKTDEGEPDGRHMAAQDMILAMNEKSPEKMAQAMANFMDLHMSKGEEPESEEG